MDELIENAMGRIQFTMYDDSIRKTRRILAMEQFRSERMAELATRYHLENLQGVYADIFAGMMVNGIQAARELRWNQPDAQIIFATSEEFFALESFDVNPINYILKPVKMEKLFETLNLEMKRISLEEEMTVTIKVKGGYCTLHLDDIMYIDYL